MSDDWEYWIEQQEEERQFLLSSRDRHRKSLICWIDGVENEIWDWHPEYEIFGWMSRLHRELKVGSKSFLARNIYSGEQQEQCLLPKSKPLQVLDGIVYEVIANESEANFDVIILSRSDLSRLKELAKSLSSTAKNMREWYFAEMIEAIADFIEMEESVNQFVIYREI